MNLDSLPFVFRPIVPWCRVMTRFARYNPIPVPACTFCFALLHLKPLSNKCVVSSGWIGNPVLTTEMTKDTGNFWTEARSAVISMVEGELEYLTAFSRRFETAWATRFFTM